ncbi:MAG: hypothetical protein IPM52_12845 [Bacteroidetes bacterium]|nr:hypothetical protein [Bacteroidota bacterium]
MKTVITTTILFTSILFASCGNSSNEQTNEDSTEQVETAVYQCPMKCEGDKMYKEEGTCPICKMDLELVTEEEDHKHHNH